MDVLLIIFSSVSLLSICNSAVPPDACFANFRWEDCGKEPQPVMYYWKPGSRCEVGTWRGCLPSLNMFKDEYECVSTCIFSVRAQPSDFHNQQASEENDEKHDEIGSDNEEGSSTTEENASNSTGTDFTTDSGYTGTGTDDGATKDSTGDGQTTEAGATAATAGNSEPPGEGTTPGDALPTTEAPAERRRR